MALKSELYTKLNKYTNLFQIDCGESSYVVLSHSRVVHRGSCMLSRTVCASFVFYKLLRKRRLAAVCMWEIISVLVMWLVLTQHFILSMICSFYKSFGCGGNYCFMFQDEMSYIKFYQKSSNNLPVKRQKKRKN